MEDEIKPVGFVTLAEGTIASDYSLKELNKALGQAQNEFEPSVKGEMNAYGGYKYTPLIAIVSAVRPSLTKYHLTVSQFPSIDLENKTVTIFTRIVHWDSGEWIQNELVLPAELALGKGGTPVFNQQTIGGSETYAMKYAYKPMVGIPDSEEMIDSSEEKGDLPSRAKKPQQQYQKPYGRNEPSFASQEPGMYDEPGRGPRKAPAVQQATQAKLNPTSPARTAESPTQQQTQSSGAGNTTQSSQQGTFLLIPPNRVTCVLINVAERTSKTGKPVVTIKFNGDIPLNQEELTNAASTFDTGLFDALKAGLNKEVQFTYKLDKDQRFVNITDVLWVDGQEFMDGKPVPEGALVSRDDNEVMP